MKTESIHITPKQAEQWLSHNTSNRPARKFWVDALAYEMTNGTFVKSHQGIAFSESGKLIDGQHRLMAIVKSGCTVEMLVTTGLNDDAFLVFDNGVKRTVADLTGLSQGTAEVCKFFAGYLYGRTVTVSSSICQEIAKSGVEDLHEELLAYCPKKVKIASSVAVRGAAIIAILNGARKEYVFEMYSKICHYDFENMPNIAHAFFKQIVANKLQANSQRTSLLARCLKVFDENYANSTRLLVSQADIDGSGQLVRSVIRDLLEANN